jgi:Protein of unknown function (DUF1194)
MAREARNAQSTFLISRGRPGRVDPSGVLMNSKLGIGPMPTHISTMFVAGTLLCGLPSSGVLAAEVDLQLILAADVSHSMSVDELQLQKDGYVAAFRHRDLVDAIQSGPLGRVAVTYLEWSGPNQQAVIVPWTVLGDAASVEAFAERLAASPTASNRGAGTAVSSALLFASQQFAASGVQSFRRTIDVSGDGVSDRGPPISWARDQVIRQHITINGLSLVLPEIGTDGFYSLLSGSDEDADIHAYYENSVIGGPGAFAIAVNDIADFGKAIRRKLILEIASRPSQFARLELDSQ